VRQVVYITALFPYFVLVIFFVRACTLKGMGDGVAHLFTPKVGGWEDGRMGG
jgi:solute carrier family 6 amino acid/orphan transporter-like 15/16/17/18/20